MVVKNDKIVDSEEKCGMNIKQEKIDSNITRFSRKVRKVNRYGVIINYN